MKRWILAGCLALAGCGDNELGFDKVRPNVPPETVLSSGPPDSTEGTSYRVQLFWSGSDRDGTIDHYDFIMVDHPPIRTHIDGDPDDDDPTRVVITVPAPDDPRWFGTASTDSVFITLADSLHRDPHPQPGENDDDVRAALFERWHTFFVRAVDNEGAPDLTPDYRSFNARNIAPEVRLLDPVQAGTTAEFEAPPVVVFNWSGRDPVDQANFKQPVASRFVMIGSKVSLNSPGDRYLSFPESLYALPARYRWSAWRRWETADGSGTRAVVSGLDRVGDFPGAGYYLFAVQAMDEAGAITPVFDYQTPGKNNVVRVRVKGDIGPLLTVRDEFLGTQAFVGGSLPIKLDIAAGQQIQFRWSGDSSRYGGEIVAYRFGWDIRTPDNDQEWSSWSLTTMAAPGRSFSTGSHRFFVQVRDNAETITQAIYELTVHTVTRSRDLLWVDDSEWADAATESQEDRRWTELLERIAASNGFTFAPNLDVFDIHDNRLEPPPIQKVFDYKAIVWSNRSGKDRSSALRRLAQFFDPIAQRNRNTAKAFNYLNIYLANGGKLWINGFRPAKQLWPDERTTGQESEPVNVTNWDDPIEPHPPGIDSVGTASLLYKMGIEMFDVGSAIESPRFNRQHFCKDLKRCNVAGADSQRTRSSTAASHTHTLPVATADVEAFFPSGRTITTSPTLGHQHTVTLAAEDFRILKQGGTVVAESSESPLPQPHRHVFEIVDQLGMWGAPILVPGLNWAQGGTGARTNVEIYDMPKAMANQRPPLIPLAGISIGLYCYVSGVPEAPGFSYPETADNQPVFVLAKGYPTEANYSRAFCGFEPFFLDEASHENLAAFILIRHFQLSGAAAP